MQETVGLPDLPQQWLEPSGLVSFIVEACFVVIAWHRLRRAQQTPPPRPNKATKRSPTFQNP
jgi:hypothetical protein